MSSCAFGDPLLVDAFTGAYLIKLNTDDWGDKLSGLGIYVPGIPANIAPPMKTFFEGK
jgi:hypothetical protein